MILVPPGEVPASGNVIPGPDLLAGGGNRDSQISAACGGVKTAVDSWIFCRQEAVGELFCREILIRQVKIGGRPWRLEARNSLILPPVVQCKFRIRRWKSPENQYEY